MQTLSELFEKFIQHRIYGNCNRPVTIKNYRENFCLLQKYKPDVGLNDLEKDCMIDFMKWLNTRERRVGNRMEIRTLRNSSVATVRGKLAAFFNWLVDNGHLKMNPFDKIPHPEVTYTDKRAFTGKEFDTIWRAVSIGIEWANPFIRKRNMTMMIFLTFTGIRKGELLGLKIQDLDMENKCVTIRGETSKSKRDKILPLNPELISYLEDYLEARADYTTDALWVSGNKDEPFTEHGLKHLVEKLKKEAGIDKFYVHRFRHTFAGNYYKKTFDILGLQKLMGHRSDKTTTKVYLRSVGDEYVNEQIRRMSIDDFVR